MPRTPRATVAATREAELRFDQRLVLNQFMLRLFCAASWDELADDEVKDPAYEQWDENNITRMYGVLKARCFKYVAQNPPGPNEDDLLRYDQNIVRHTQRISERRGVPIRWKYFQYLALLFTELYLDKYFTDAETFRTQLNTHVVSFNIGKGAKNQVKPFAANDLRKLAFWMATGSGKTLLMHMHILQYQDYLAQANRTGELNRIILLTPNEGLSRQHRDEFAASGIEAELLQKDARSLFAGSAVEILDVNKLSDEAGPKTVAVESFEGNNLVLVDEGHRGVGGEKWKDWRDELCRDGFSFEYSATFGQAVKATSGAKKEPLLQEYAKCILFDYSYRYFYRDGYGKDYQILNLGAAHEDDQHHYLVASLLAFHQQQRYYRDHTVALQPYGIEPPLWVFVGGRVTQSVSEYEATDIQAVLLFLGRFVSERGESVSILNSLMEGVSPFQSGTRDIFAGKFAYLRGKRLTGEDCYTAILSTFFNASGSGRLHLRAIQGADGEIAVRIGNNAPFGVVNIGDVAGFRKLFGGDEHVIFDEDAVIGASLFRSLNEPTSSVNMLIGSRKFTEGWNSYRVSSMGLMKIGKTEGAQIIQLFGRGVRLRGYNGTLQRSTADDLKSVEHPKDIGIIETLNVYGVEATYMEQFKEYLAEEGLPTHENMRDMQINVTHRVPTGKLKTIRLRGDQDFKTHGTPFALDMPPREITEDRKVTLDMYAKVEVLESKDMQIATATSDVCNLTPFHIGLLDLDRVYFDVVRFKAERGWNNMRVEKGMLRKLLMATDWYDLKIPANALKLQGGDLRTKLQIWHEAATGLLRKYCERYYKIEQERFESSRREYRVLDASDDNIIEKYEFQVSEEQREIVAAIEDTIKAVAAGTFLRFYFSRFEIFDVRQHLYFPLVHEEKMSVKVKPVALNAGERTFLRDVSSYYQKHADWFASRELYLLRNLSRGKGVGFFEAGNFYPDFIMWLLDGDTQYITFVDPKGIAHLDRENDPKIVFYRDIKQIQRELGDKNVVLNSFIASVTSYNDVSTWMSKAEFTQHHVLFQEDGEAYVQQLFDALSAPQSASLME